MKTSLKFISQLIVFKALIIELISADPCATATLTIDSTIIPSVISYSIYEAVDVQTLLVSKVTSSEPGCPAIELAILVDDDSSIDGTVFTVDDANAPTFYSLTTETSDTAKTSTYNYKVVAKYTGAAYTYAGELPFQIVIDDPCASAILTIDSTIIPSVISYSIYVSHSIYEVVDVQNLWVSKVTSSEPGCPAIELAILVDDDSSIDGTVFTVDDANAPTFYSLTTETSDTAKTSTYNYKVVAKYTGAAYTYAGELPFQIVIDDPCASAILTIDPTIFTSLSILYDIFYPTHIETLNSSTVTSTFSLNCPGYLFSFTE